MNLKKLKKKCHWLHYIIWIDQLCLFFQSECNAFYCLKILIIQNMGENTAVLKKLGKYSRIVSILLFKVRETTVVV